MRFCDRPRSPKGPSSRFSASPATPPETPKPEPKSSTGFSAKPAAPIFRSSLAHQPTPRIWWNSHGAVWRGRSRPRKASHPSATDFILEQIRRYPGQITLIAIGPLMNVGALIDKDPATFLKLKRVVMMGGSIECGYGELWFCPQRGPDAEWNIINDIPSAKKLFLSGVPLFVMPLDSTQLKLDETKRAYLFKQGTPLTDALTLLYHEWGQQTPTLFDPVTVAFILDPKVCPVEPMHIRVDDKALHSPRARPSQRPSLHAFRRRRFLPPPNRPPGCTLTCLADPPSVLHYTLEANS